MKNRDKLEQYIKKEIESIPYTAEDQMWNDFQKSNSKDLEKWNTPPYLRAFLFGSLILTFLALAVVTYNKVQPSLTNSDVSKISQNASSEKAMQDLKIEKHSFTEKETSIDNQNQTEQLNLLEKGQTLGLGQNNSVAETNTTNHFSQDKRLSNDRQNSQNQVGAKPSPEEATHSENNVSTNSYNDLQQPASTTAANIENNTFPFSDPTKNTTTKTDAFNEKESASNLLKAAEKTSKTFSMTKIDLVSTEPSFGGILFPALGKDVKPVAVISSFKRKDRWYVKLLFSASSNQIYRSAFEVGRVKPLARTRYFSYGLGLSLEDGYSVSQDSIFYTTGITLEELRKDKDLDYLISSYINTAYTIKKGRFSASLGLRLSYALANKFNGYNRKYNTYFSGNYESSDPREYSNLWTGINRFGVDGSFAVSYSIGEFELSLLTSKRINKLIKGDNAKSRKSNIPFQFGASITKHF